MGLKERISGRLVQEAYQLLSAPYFMRLSNVLWRMVNERQQAKRGAEADWALLTEQLQRLEQRAGQLEAKAEALGHLLESREAPAAPRRTSGKRAPARSARKNKPAPRKKNPKKG